MPPIRFFKNIWTKEIKVKERLYFSLVLLGFTMLYFYSQFKNHAIPLAEFQMEFYVLAGFLFSFVLIDFWGQFIVHLWLSVSGIIGQFIFLVVLVLTYYLILSPIFIFVNLFKKKKVKLNSNWTNQAYINKDYKSMG